MAKPPGPLQLPLLAPKTDWTAPNLADIPPLSRFSRIALDTETRDEDLMKLGPGFRRGAYVVGISLGIPDVGNWYLPIRHEGGGNMDEAQVLAWLRENLGSYTGEVVGANLGYDLDGLENEGVRLGRVKAFHDVQVAEPLLDEWRMEYNLGALAREYLGEDKVEEHLDAVRVAWKWKNTQELKSNLWRLPAADVGPYAEGDCDLPLRIFPKQYKKMEAEGLLQIYEIERKLIPILVAMRRRGVRVDLDRAEQVREMLVQERERWVKEVRRHAGPRAELGKPETFVKALRERGFNVFMTPKSGKPQIDKDFLEAHRGDALVDALASGRRVGTLISTFMDGHILGHNIAGRIHCEFNQLKREKEDGGRAGTIARFSSSNPNLQNIPKRESEFDEAIDFGGMDVVHLIRGMFIPDEGEDWVRHDLSQIEFRLLTHYAQGTGAEGARQTYRNDPKVSFHKMAAGFMGVDPEQKKIYDRIKNTNFAAVYNAGIQQIAATFGCSVEEAKAFMTTYNSKLPFVKKTNNSAMEVAGARGYIKTVLGRRAHFPNWEPRDYETRQRSGIRRGLPLDQAERAWPDRPLQRAFTHAALNRLLQGSCADVAKKAMVDAWEAGVNDVVGPMLITVHDEADYSVPRTKEGAEAIDEAQRLMENAVKLNVPVYAEAKRGANWGETS